MDENKNKGRGFASMSEEKRRKIASKGGRAAHKKGTAHEWDSEEARVAGQQGGQTRADNLMNDQDDLEY